MNYDHNFVLLQKYLFYNILRFNSKCFILPQIRTQNNTKLSPKNILNGITIVDRMDCSKLELYLDTSIYE